MRRAVRETLTIAQRFMGLPHRRVEEMLDLVSLTPSEPSRPVRDYSLGMRQRLGIAGARVSGRDPDCGGGSGAPVESSPESSAVACREPDGSR